MFEAKVLRIGGQYYRFNFLCAAYGMFCSVSAKNEAPLHMQVMMDRLIRLFCRVVDGQEQTWKMPTTPLDINPLFGAAKEAAPSESPMLALSPTQYFTFDQGEVNAQSVESWDWSSHG